MAASKKDLAQKIAIMQVAKAGGKIFTKAEGSQVWSETKNPVFNWGISDYKVVTDYTSLLTNPENTTLNFVDLVSDLSAMERGKKLPDEIQYTTDNLNNAKMLVKDEISKTIDIDCASLDKASLADSNFFKVLISTAHGKEELIDDYIKEIQSIAKTTLKTSIISAANKIIDNTIDAEISKLPKDESALYKNNAPTTESLKATVSTLSEKAADLYTDSPDGTVIELEENGITLRFWKNIAQENVLSVSYDLAKSTIGADPEVGVVVNSAGNISYNTVSVTKTELDNAIKNAIATAYVADDISADKIIEQVKKLDAELKSETLEETENIVKANNNELIAKAKSDAEALDRALHTEMDASFKKILLEAMYPIGSIYWSSKPTSPDGLFGGKWKAIKDRFILAAGDTYASDGTGGNSTVTLANENLPSHSHTFSGTTANNSVSHTHTFTTGAMSKNASHRHKMTDDNNSPMPSAGDGGDWSASGTGGGSWHWCEYANTDHTHSGTTDAPSSTSHAHTYSGTTGSVGSGTAVNIMPPYEVKYCWERVE